MDNLRQNGHFYFIDDSFFVRFSGTNLMINHISDDTGSHNRPYLYCFTDKNGLSWYVPISSQINKYQSIYNQKTQNNKKCDTITFHNVLYRNRAFLIQNMCPITDNYIINEYLENNSSVTVTKSTFIDVKQKSIKMLSLQRKGNRYLLTNVLKIEQELLGI